jgi:hypothetical protein
MSLPGPSDLAEMDGAHVLRDQGTGEGRRRVLRLDVLVVVP